MIDAHNFYLIANIRNNKVLFYMYISFNVYLCKSNKKPDSHCAMCK